MNDLVQFLRERLDYEECVARSAESDSAEWYAASADDEPRNSQRAQVISGKDARITGDTDAGYADHVAFYDPARALRRLALMRALLDTYAEVADMDTPATEFEFANGRAIGLGIAVRQLAAEYSHLPDFKPEWSPGFCT